MASLEEIQSLLGQVLAAQQTAHQELSEFRSQQIAHNNTSAEAMQNIDTRLTILEIKSRPPSPGPSGAEETARKATFAPSPVKGVPPETPYFHASGLPITPAPGKSDRGKQERQDKQEKNPERRETIHLRSLVNLEAKSQFPVVHKTLASTAHITYTRSSVKTFFKFWEDVAKFEMKEQSGLPNVNALIDSSVVKALVATDRKKLDEFKFYALSRAELYDLMQSVFRPKDKLDFMKKLEANVEFSFQADYRPTPEYFQFFYNALLLYSSTFTKVFEILVHGADPKLVLPRCDNKPGGLVKAFVEKIPFEYGKNVLRLFDVDKWVDFYAFNKAFMDLVEEHNADGERARKLRRCFGGTHYESKKFEQKVHALQQLCAAPPDPTIPDDVHEEMVQIEGELLDQEVDVLLAAMQQPHGKGPPNKPSYDKSAPREPMVCIGKLLKGTCTKTQCNFSHKEEDINKKRHEFLKLINEQLAASKSSAAAQRVHNIAPLVEDRYDDDY